MSVSAINWAFEQCIKKSSAKLILLSLADYANDENIAYPSMTTLQKKGTCSRDTVVKSIKSLLESGHISKVSLEDHVGKKYSNNQNCYKLNVGSTKIGLVRKQDQSENRTTTSTEIGLPLVRKSDSNHHTTINKPLLKKINKKKDSALGLNEKQKVTKIKSKAYDWKLDLESTLHDAFDSYLEMRTENKHKLTSRAIQLLVKKINSFDPSLRLEIIENATVSNWKSFYHNQNNFTANGPKVATNSSKKLKGNSLTDHNVSIWEKFQ